VTESDFWDGDPMSKDYWRVQTFSVSQTKGLNHSVSCLWKRFAPAGQWLPLPLGVLWKLSMSHAGCW
jgi:hypothetical protein